MPRRYVPRRGDIVWLSFTPQAGHEQAGRRPALVLSPSTYNRKVGLALFCQTSRPDRTRSLPMLRFDPRHKDFGPKPTFELFRVGTLQE